MTAVQDHSASTPLLTPRLPASVWVLFHGQLVYRLGDGCLTHRPHSDREPVTDLVHLTGSPDRLVCGPADSLGVFCEGQIQSIMPLAHPLTETATEAVHFV